MDTTTFYAAAAGLFFTLLGFWWVVVQFGHAESTRDAASGRFMFLVSMHFILPGLVSLASLLATGPMWRVAFAVAGLTGIAAAIAGTRAALSLTEAGLIDEYRIYLHRSCSARARRTCADPARRCASWRTTRSTTT